MDKKEYIQPAVKVLVIKEKTAILAGSADSYTVDDRDIYDENLSGAKPYDDSDYFNW